MLGSFVRRCSSYALFSTLVLSASAVLMAQPAAGGTDTNILLDDLVSAIDRDDKLGVMLVISQGFPADVMDSNGSTMLMQAAKGGKVKVAQFLLDSGADPNMIADNGATALMLAVNAGHLSTVQALLAGKADPNLRGPGVPPALTFAVAKGDIGIIQALIKSGASLNARDQKGYNALEFAFLNKSAPVLKYLRPFYRAKATRLDLSAVKLGKAIAEKDLDSMIGSLALGFNPNHLIGGKLPLELAKRAGYDKGVALLIHAGARSKTDLITAAK